MLLHSPMKLQKRHTRSDENGATAFVYSCVKGGGKQNSPQENTEKRSLWTPPRRRMRQVTDCAKSSKECGLGGALPLLQSAAAAMHFYAICASAGAVAKA
jgi:hypothetical protein